jgi:beta-lactamase regulating signal transducer with metallopeptidase domain
VDAVANWLWQGSALAAGVTVLLRVLQPRVSATTRYRIWWIALASILALPALPALAALRPAASPSAGGFLPGYAVPVPVPALPWWPAWLLAGACLGWTAWSLYRVARALAHLQQAKRNCRQFPGDRESRLVRWNTLRHRGRRARLVVSDEIRAASVLGLTSPAIAVSPALLHGLDDDELECILVHEWAHVQRRDDVGRLLQLLVRAMAGLHPGIWWVDRQMHLDRETACDDWAINLTGSARRYARCLTKLASLDLAARDRLLLPAALSSSELTRRVVRVLDARRSTSTKRPGAATAMTVPLMVTLAALVASVELVVTAAPMPSTSSASAAREILDRPVTFIARYPLLTDQRPTSSRSRPAGGTAEAPVAQRSLAAGRPKSGPPAPSLQPSSVDANGPAAPVESPVGDALPGTALPVGTMLATEAAAPTPADAVSVKPNTAWGAAANAGVSVGRGSQKAAEATAGFFSRLGKSVAGAF